MLERLHRARGRRGLSLIDALMAALVLGVLGLTVQSLMVSTLRGVRVDRLTEAKRHVVLDYLEWLCHPYSPIASIVPPPTAETGPLPTSGDQLPPLTRELTVDEAVDRLAIPEKEAEVMKQILKSGHVQGFTLTWTRRIKPGAGDPSRTWRLDRLTVSTKVTREHQGPLIDSFRIFYMNNG